MNNTALLCLLCAIVSVTIVQAHNFSFPASAPWYQDVSAAAVAPNSEAILALLNSKGVWAANGGNTAPNFQVDMSFNIQYASSSTPLYTFNKDDDYTNTDCDDISKFPVTPNGAYEGGGAYSDGCGENDDCHYLVVDQVHNKLYESYQTTIDTGSQSITSTCGVVWDLCANYPTNLRGDQCTSTDAAGFPIAPLLVSADELAAGVVNHALRFILPNEVMKQKAYVHPATHAGGPSSTDANAIIYGTRLRLKSTFDPSLLTETASDAAKVVITALKKYGMFLADGGNIPLSFADDTFTTAKYDDLNFDSHSLWGIKATDFEVIAYDTPIVLTYDCVRTIVPAGTCAGTTAAATTAAATTVAATVATTTTKPTTVAATTTTKSTTVAVTATTKSTTAAATTTTKAATTTTAAATTTTTTATTATATATATPATTSTATTGSAATLPSAFSFPAGSPWYQDVSSATLDSNSPAIVSYLNGQGIWTNSFQVDTSINIQYATASTPRYTLTPSSDGYTFPDCDNITMFPVPAGGAIEGAPYNSPCSGDCHYIVVDTVNNKLYESYQTTVDTSKKTVTSTCGVEWDLCRLYPKNLRGDQCTSVDAAGFPIAPLLVTADEMASGQINHAMRFILPNNVMKKGEYVHPATHAGGPSSTDPNAPIYGTRFRLKASFDPTTRLTEKPIGNGALAVVAALKKYGMFLADGGNIPLTFADDAFTTHKYADADIGFDSHSLFGIKATDFEVVAHDTPVTLTYDCVRNSFTDTPKCTGGNVGSASSLQVFVFLYALVVLVLCL